MTSGMYDVKVKAYDVEGNEAEIDLSSDCTGKTLNCTLGYTCSGENIKTCTAGGGYCSGGTSYTCSGKGKQCSGGSSYVGCAQGATDHIYHSHVWYCSSCNILGQYVTHEATVCSGCKKTMTSYYCHAIEGTIGFRAGYSNDANDCCHSSESDTKKTFTTKCSHGLLEAHEYCSHGKTSSHTVYSNCSHGYSNSHTVKCSHGYTTSHEYNAGCSHGYTVPHDVLCPHGIKVAHEYCEHNLNSVPHHVPAITIASSWEIVSNGTYKFISDTTYPMKWVSNNAGISSSTATSTWGIELTEPVSYKIKYKVSSETNYDKFSIYLDGKTIVSSISGDGNEIEREVELPAGTHQIRCTYIKDSSVNKYDDCAYVVLEDII